MRRSRGLCWFIRRGLSRAPVLRFANVRFPVEHSHNAPQIEFEAPLFGQALSELHDEASDEGGYGGRPSAQESEPIPDHLIVGVDPRRLRREQLIWVVGRAATCKITCEELWLGFQEAIEALGESQLTPSEVCRLVQAFAYAPREAPLDAKQLQRLVKAFALRAAEYSDERLARVIYGYGKLAGKRGLRWQKFLDFVSSEVLERSIKLRGWPSFRILRSVWQVHGAQQDFHTVLASQVMKKVENLDLESLRAFVPMLVELRFHERPGVLGKLNTVFKRKLHTYQGAEVLLQTGMTLMLHDLLKTTTLAMWFTRLLDLGILCSAAAATARAEEGTQQGTAVGATVQHPAGCGRPDNLATENLLALKIAEMCLRHERPSVLARLPPRVLQLLADVRGTPLQPAEDHRMFELPFVFAELRRLCCSLGLTLHPTLFGPYLLELADPFGQIILEWDSNWALYPPWRRTQHRKFVERKRLHLAAEGWTVLCIPFLEFQSLKCPDERRDYLDAFIKRQGIDHLRLT